MLIARSAQNNDPGRQSCNPRAESVTEFLNHLIEVRQVKASVHETLRKRPADHHDPPGAIAVYLRDHVLEPGVMKNQKALTSGNHRLRVSR